MLNETVRYFNLNEDCFQLNFDMKYFYESVQHKEAYVRMKYSIDSKYPFFLFAGWPGSGKTVVSRLMDIHLNNSRSDKIKYKTVYIDSATKEFITLFRLIMTRLTGQKYSDADEYKLHTDYREIILKFNEENTYIVVFLDEAHNYSTDTLEYIRQLTNIAETSKNYMTICLIGQPELNKNVKNLPQLDKRIMIRCLLSPLDMKATADYIYFRLSRAGGVYKVFTNDALEYLHMITGGIPREINNCCNACFDLAMLKLEKKINKKIVSTAQEELFKIKTETEDDFDVTLYK